MGQTWSWNFDCHLVGYGYDGFFLGYHPYYVPGENNEITVAGIVFQLTDSFKRHSIVSPSESLVIGDKEPYGNPPSWSCSLWWEDACMNPAVVQYSGFPDYEGVEPNRHLGRAVMSFNDGHSEWRASSLINPPANPYDQSEQSLINSRYWDPLQRAGKM